MTKSRFVNFSKMQALGNDFVIVNNLNNDISFPEISIQKLAHRQLGIGFDQLLILEKSQRADFACRIFNADGSEAEQCGNGLRCVVKYIRDQQLSHNKNLRIETKAGIFDADMVDHHLIQISLGTPCFTPKKIPLKMPQSKIYHFEILSHPISATVLALGNPHFITQVDSLKHFPAKEWGETIAKLPVFPNSTNVGFMEIINPTHIRLQTFERGVGLTHACGSNACAAVVAGIVNHHLEKKVTVELELGSLLVEWPDENGPVFLTGPAENVFEGRLAF